MDSKERKAVFKINYSTLKTKDKIWKIYQYYQFSSHLMYYLILKILGCISGMVQIDPQSMCEVSNRWLMIGYLPNIRAWLITPPKQYATKNIIGQDLSFITNSIMNCIRTYPATCHLNQGS